MMTVLCEKCKEKQKVRERYKFFRCCGMQQEVYTHLVFKSDKDKYKNWDSFKDDKKKEVHLINDSDEEKIMNVVPKKEKEEIQEEEQEETVEIKEEEEEKEEPPKIYKFQCAYCNAMFDEYENNQCPHCQEEF